MRNPTGKHRGPDIGSAGRRGRCTYDGGGGRCVLPKGHSGSHSLGLETKRIDSTFALLDVKKGRTGLRKRLADMGNGARIPVVIRGYITRVWGNDDGVSIEFEIEVESAEELP